MSSFNTCIAQHVSSYLATVSFITIGEISAVLYTVVTLVAAFSWVYDCYILAYASFRYAVCRYERFST
jgi:hypothetical protein